MDTKKVLRHLYESSEQSGRSVLLLVVTDCDGADPVPPRLARILMYRSATLSLKMTRSIFGRHLNKYLEPKGSPRSTVSGEVSTNRSYRRSATSGQRK